FSAPINLPASGPVRASTISQKTSTRYLDRRPHGSAAIRPARLGPGAGGELVLSVTRSSPAGWPVNGWAGKRGVRYDVSRSASGCQVISRVVEAGSRPAPGPLSADSTAGRKRRALG